MVIPNMGTGVANPKGAARHLPWGSHMRERSVGERTHVPCVWGGWGGQGWESGGGSA